MSLRKKQQGTPSGDGNPSTQIGIGGIVADEEEEDKYKAYADQQNAKVWTYIFVITLCIVVWASALTSWMILGGGRASGSTRLGSKQNINAIAKAQLESSPLQAEIRALKDELVKEEKKEAALLGKYEKLERYTNQLRDQENKLWTEENQRWKKISPELQSKIGSLKPPVLLPGIPGSHLAPPEPLPRLKPASTLDNKNTQLGDDPNRAAASFEKIVKGKSKLSPVGEKIRGMNIEDEILKATSDEEINAVTTKIVEVMSVEELIGSILVVGVSTYEYTRELDQCIRNGNVGGIFLHRDMTTKSKKKEVIKKYTDWLNERSTLALGEYFPLIIASDDEGGHFNNYPYAFSEWPNNLGLASVNDTIAAHRFGLEYGKELKSVGINVVFGPCMDVNIEPKNPVIGVRSFGSNPQTVGSLGSAVVKGFLDAGIFSNIKAFSWTRKNYNGLACELAHHQGSCVIFATGRTEAISNGNRQRRTSSNVWTLGCTRFREKEWLACDIF